MGAVVPLTGLVLAAFTHWGGWGQGRLNWGPRLGALFLLLLGEVVFAGTVVGEYATRGMTIVAQWTGDLLAHAVGPAVGHAIAALIPWAAAFCLSLYWLFAWLPAAGAKAKAAAPVPAPGNGSGPVAVAVAKGGGRGKGGKGFAGELLEVLGERMTWRLAWLGTVIPLFVHAIPGPAGNGLGWTFATLGHLGYSIIAAPFGWAGVAL